MRDASKTCLNGRTVLVVEDAYYLANDLASALEAAGARVVGPVATVQEAEAKMAEGGLDGAVIDMNLRGSSGAPIAARLARSGTPFLLTTGYGSGSLPEGCENLPVLQKPFDTARAVERLSDLIAGEPSRRT